MNDTNVFVLLIRVTVSLGVVLGLLWLTARLLGQRGIGKGFRPKGSPIEVVARQSLNKRASVALVRTAGRGLVLGITEAGVTVLAETDPDDLLAGIVGVEAVEITEAAGTQPPSPRPAGLTAVPAWKDVVDGLRDRTVRRAS